MRTEQQKMGWLRETIHNMLQQLLLYTLYILYNMCAQYVQFLDFLYEIATQEFFSILEILCELCCLISGPLWCVTLHLTVILSVLPL